jgi:hypothetical protein
MMITMGMVLAVCAASAVAGDATVGADLATAYVFRGATFNDGLVLQPYAEIGGLPVTLSVWGNMDIDDYDGALKDGEFSEIDLAAAYVLPLGLEALEVSTGYTEYLYPGSETEADREISLGFALDLPLSPSLSVFYGLDGGIEKSLHAEFGIGHTFEIDKLTLELAALIAYEDPDGGESGFSYFTASVSAGYAMLSASLTYVGQIDDDVLPDVADGGSYDVEVYGTIGISHAF